MGLNRAASILANRLIAALAVSLFGGLVIWISNNTLPNASAKRCEGGNPDTHTASSATNAPLMKPTSCPIPALALRDRSAVLADRAKSSQSVPRPFEVVAPHNFALVLRRYRLLGKKAEVQVLGSKYIQLPAVVSVYCGYSIGEGRAWKVARLFCAMRGEKSSGGTPANTNSKVFSKNKMTIIKKNGLFFLVSM